MAANPAYGFTVPPIVEILDHLEEHAFTALHASTASGMGLLALLAAKLLHLPITGTFHTDLARYAERLCPGSLVQRNTWRYTMWFYGMLDQVLVPSRTSARELVARGLDPGRVRVLPRWVDDELFAPEHRDESLRARYCRDGEPLLVYAGREHMLSVAGRPKAHGDAILKSVDVAAPRPGWRHAADLKMALDLAQKDRLRR